MKILVFSDTHGSSARMLEIIEAQRSKVDAIFFLGDGQCDADDIETFYPQVPLYRVRGNSDFGSFYPEKGLVPLGGVLFFYTHGHRYNVKHGTGTLVQATIHNGGTCALFGHTHTPLNKQVGGIHVFNPGSLTLPRGSGPTYGLITVADGVASFRIVPYQPKEAV